MDIFFFTPTPTQGKYHSRLFDIWNSVFLLWRKFWEGNCLVKRLVIFLVFLCHAKGVGNFHTTYHVGLSLTFSVKYFKFLGYEPESIPEVWLVSMFRKIGLLSPGLIRIFHCSPLWPWEVTLYRTSLPNRPSVRTYLYFRFEKIFCIIVSTK